MFFLFPDFAVAGLEEPDLVPAAVGVAVLGVLGLLATTFGVAGFGSGFAGAVFLFKASSTALLSSSASKIFFDGFRFLGDIC